ncbi:SURF1 family protein [Sphingomonas oryzagri]|uniref:SURF1-like protein n=1 Tax=Sphingomonas oryzagri TaxID=3042314 RepID=A0ABT6N667_9SPHN|nr:SURF1 family protein [Sphingomonas oryzagri]MDH7640591.1 SURF1 family protein [Sphingomonas oryzagri]
MKIRIPILPTLLVMLAAGIMIWLGIWQLHRLHWKEGLLAEYRAAAGKPPVAFPRDLTDQSLLFRKSEAFCLQPVGWRASAGRNEAGQSGWKHIADCRTGAEGPGFAVDMGWSEKPDAPAGWKGGEVSGVIGPDHDDQILIVSAVAAPGLQPSQPPSLDDVPNNHLAYAVQWFIFAGLAVLIYGIALWRRGRVSAG